MDVLIVRDGEEKTLSVLVDPYPEEGATLAKAEPNESQGDNVIGAEMVALNRQSREKYQVPDNAQGVLVVAVTEGSLAAQNGIIAGDLIQRVGRKAVSKPADVLGAVNEAIRNRRDTVVFLFNRAGSSSFVPFKLD